MTTFFQQTAQAMIAKHIDRFPLWYYCQENRITSYKTVEIGGF